MNIWQEISINNLKFNLKSIRSFVNNNAKILAVVKANAYGHNYKIISSALEQEGVSYFGVASVDEGIQLREHGIKANILVLGGVLEEEFINITKYELIPTISCLKFAEKLENFLQLQSVINKQHSKSEYSLNQNKEEHSISSQTVLENSPIKIHIKIDTGMGRYGVCYEKAEELIRYVLRQKFLKVDGIYTHLSSAEEDGVFTRKQMEKIYNIIEVFSKEQIEFSNVHILNTAGIINNYYDNKSNMIRLGVLLYGIYSTLDKREKIEIKPVMQWKTKIVFLKDVEKDSTISYGGSFITKKAMRIAIIPVGYSQGLDRALSNTGEVLIKGKRVKILGKVCMDQTIIDVTDVLDVKLGDEVVLIGEQGNESITVLDIASKLNKIPYEILCAINANIPKIEII
jgi:alanine racemase